MQQPSIPVSPRRGLGPDSDVVVPAQTCLTLVRRALDLHASGYKAYGLLLAEPGRVLEPSGFVLLDPHRNRRNEPGIRAAFEAQGPYFRAYDDAGFVADSTDLLAAYRQADAAGLDVVAVFHVHRRQPANFSVIDYRLHNPAFSWHLIVSLRDPARPVLQPFRVLARPDGYGIDAADDREGSERDYLGPEVAPLGLVASGEAAELAALRALGVAADRPAVLPRPRRPEPERLPR